MNTILKPYILYFVHTHGAGHRATFQMLYPALQQTFNVVALTTNDAVYTDLRQNQKLTVIKLPSKSPANAPALEHTFSKAFEATPYATEAADRAGALVEIIKRYKPVALYCDGLPELAIMARSMGVPVVLVHLPGNAMADPTQVFAYKLADHIVAHFPEVLEQPHYAFEDKTFYSGYMSRYANQEPAVDTEDNSVISVLMGYDNYDDKVVKNMTADAKHTFVIIGNHHNYLLGRHCHQLGRITDVAAAIKGNIVITAAGQNSVAELISLKKRLILLPESRPYDEQLMSALALVKNGSALLADTSYTAEDWLKVIKQANDLAPDSSLVNVNAPDDIAAKLIEWYVRV
jgi:UDP-N-acetylglucosamine:LPS N-acetylglucosamine transferase